jgi:hypothetical protein
MPRNSMTKLVKKSQKPLELRGSAPKIVIEFRPAEIRVKEAVFRGFAGFPRAGLNGPWW